MERLVLFLCGVWVWLTRNTRSLYYQQVAEYLGAAQLYLNDDFNGWASNQDRGGLLPHQSEALHILEQQRELARQTSSRLGSLSECVRIVSEELLGPRKAA